MTTETFTESAAPDVQRDPLTGMPFPEGPETAIGWRVQMEVLGDVYEGTVKGSTFSRVGIVWDGDCPRKCCWDEVPFKDVEFTGLEVCDYCESGKPKVLCLCEDIEDETEEAEMAAQAAAEEAAQGSAS
jgi:hypothetical protein